MLAVSVMSAQEPGQLALSLSCSPSLHSPQLAPTGSTSLLSSMAVIQNPVKVCDQVFDLIENLTHQIRERMQDPKSVGGFKHYCLQGLGVDGFLRPPRALLYVSKASHPHLSGSASDVPGSSVRAK